VSGQDRAVLLRCLSTTLDSGVGVDRSLDLLAQQQESRDLAQACQGMARWVRNGNYLSAAMARFPWVFTRLHRRLVQVGESTGSLVQVLQRLSLYEEKQLDLNLKIRSSLTTPALVCVLCITLVIFIPPLLFDGLFEMLRDSNTAIPWPTQLLMSFSVMLRSRLFYAALLIGGLAGVPLLHRAYHHRGLAKRVMAWALAVPILGKNLRLIAVTRFLQSLEIMLRVGLPILTSLEMAAASSDNPVLEEAIQGAVESVKQGDEIHVALARSEFFPLTVIHSVEVGEQSGKLCAMLESLVRLYNIELESAFETLARSLEPLVISLIGAIVGFTVIATLLPLVKLIETL
jgi:type IV pilus assembly protein PilC